MAGLTVTFPAQQRPPADPAVVARGKGLYESTAAPATGRISAAAIMGGPNLLRSALR